MRTIPATVLVLGILLVCNAAVAERMGTVSAPGPFKLRGENVSGPAAQGLVVVSGDELETLEHEAILTLLDGSRVVADKGSTVKILQADTWPLVGLVRGGLRFQAAAGSRLRFCVLSRLLTPSASASGLVSIGSAGQVQAAAEQGVLSVDDKRACSLDGKPGGWLTRNRAIVLVGSTAAAGTAAGIAKARNAPPSVPLEPPPLSKK